MKLKIRKLAIAAFSAIAIIGATANVNVASKDTAAKTNTIAIHRQTDQGTIAQFDSAKEGMTFAAKIEGKGIGTQTANWTGIGTQDNIGVTNNNGYTASMNWALTTNTAAVVNATDTGLLTKTTSQTAEHAANGTINVVSNKDATHEVFGGTVQDSPQSA